MKFHVTRDDDGDAVDFIVQVRLPTPRLKYNGPRGCVCTKLYPVVMGSIGQEHVKQGAMVDNPKKFVCDCHGEVVA